MKQIEVRPAGKVLFECVIMSRPPVKKNTQRIFGTGRRKRAVYSIQYITWKNEAICHLRAARLRDPIEVPVILCLKFFFQNRASEADVSNLVEAPQDVLVEAGILKDDRLVRQLIAEKVFNEEPRTEITILEFPEAI